MAQSTEGSLLEKLLESRYPLTNYLYRQQQFIKTHSTTPSVAVPTPLSSKPTTTVVQKRKTPLPPPSYFNVPDTLDFNASEFERNDDMDQSSGIEGNALQEFDETLLKSITNRINNSNSDLMNEKNTSIIQRSSGIQLEFSPYENNSPVRKAIQNGLNIINK